MGNSAALAVVLYWSGNETGATEEGVEHAVVSHPLIISPFDHLLQALLLRPDKPLHVTAQEEKIGDAAEYAQRRFPLQQIAHERAAVSGMELVDMAQSFESAADHLVHEPARPVHFDDPGREALADSEVSSLHGDPVSEL